MADFADGAKSGVACSHGGCCGSFSVGSRALEQVPYFANWVLNLDIDGVGKPDPGGLVRTEHANLVLETFASGALSGQLLDVGFSQVMYF